MQAHEQGRHHADWDGASLKKAERGDQLAFTIAIYDRRMLLARIRNCVATHSTRWCLAGMALVVLLPFIAAHYRCDGLEDEPMLRLHAASETVQFEADDRADHPADHETTVFAQTPASIDHPDAFNVALNTLMAAVLAVLPLVLAMMRLVVPIVRTFPDRVPTQGGAPPPAMPWRRLPPTTAPPFTV
ncbi:hypothetical protein ACSFBM_33745 [Variovorax sp. GB1R11]|uniref:hypothetical protein n=1 Tax=Variovorax sp. GB1R11 TaxID=3443741 RepID=UPI003F476DEF